MPDIPIEELVYGGPALIGGGLLLFWLLVHDAGPRVLEVRARGRALAPLVLVFVAGFGVGGWFATQIVGVHDAQAAVVAAGFGVVGLGLAFVLEGRRQRAED